MNANSNILLQRIKFAVRRSTGRVVDMDAMLGRPELRMPRIRAWRQLGSPDLDHLLDQLESEFEQEDATRAPRGKVIPTARGALTLVPSART